MNPSLFERLQRYDARRASLPGEHLIVLGAGLWLLSRPGSVAVGRMLAMALGVALVYRAASGRDGLIRLLPAVERRLARRGRSARQRELDEPQPYSKRVRVPAISQPLDKTMWTP
jgi:hypothetical protein